MRVTGHHWAVLLDFCEQHPQIITNKYAGAHTGREEHKKLWEQLATLLNSLGYGEKSVEEWKKALTDWKSKTKAKAANLHRSQLKTGGGPSSTSILTDYEDRLLCAMGKTAVDGNPAIREIGIPSNAMQPIQSTSTYHSSLPAPSTSSTINNIQILSPPTQTLSTPEQVNCRAKRPRKLEYSANSVSQEPPEISTKPNDNKKRKKNSEVPELKQMNDQVLVVLNKINDNMSVMNSHFTRLLDVLDKWSK